MTRSLPIPPPRVFLGQTFSAVAVRTDYDADAHTMTLGPMRREDGSPMTSVHDIPMEPVARVAVPYPAVMATGRLHKVRATTPAWDGRSARPPTEVYLHLEAVELPNP